MGSKLKDKKICIYRYTEAGGNSNGFPAESYIKIHDGKLWAYYRQTSAQEFFAAMSNQYKEEAIFIINWLPDLDARTDVILYRHCVYKINRIDDYEGYKKELRISAKFAAKDKPDDYPGMIDE